MLGTLRNTMRRTLVLTGLAVAAITLASAAGLMVKGAQVNGSTLVIVVSNPSSQPLTGTVQAVVLVNGAQETLVAAVVLAPGQSTQVTMKASGPIAGPIDAGIIVDTPTPY